MSEQRHVLLKPANLIALTILIGASIWLAAWFYDRSRFIYVNDARVASTMINISSRIPGWITQFPLEEGQRVTPGQLLVEIDTRDATLQLKEVEAGIETLHVQRERTQLELGLAEKQVKSHIASERATLEAVRAGLSEAAVERARAEQDFARTTALLTQKMISTEAWEMKKADRDKAQEMYNRHLAEVEASKAMVATAEADLSKLDVIAKELEIADQRANAMQVERTRLENALADHKILSPIHGIVDETFINPGEHVYPGQRILMLHDPDRVWIKANIKETEIRYLRVGDRVSVSVDAYPDRAFEGKITNIGSSATSQFAMLPSPNPSGNFTKVTQRLEVKIELREQAHELKPGMMVELQIPRNS